MHVHALAHTHVIGAARQHAAAPACWTAADSPGRTGRAAPAACRSHVARQRHLGTGAVPCSGIHAHTPLYAEPTCLWTNSSSRPAPIGPARGAAPRLAMLAGPSASGPPDAMSHRSMHAHAAPCTGPTCLWSNNGPRPAPKGPAPTGRRPQPQHAPRLTHRGRAVQQVGRPLGKFREKFRETSSTPPPSAHNRPQADLILVLGRDIVRAYFQCGTELTGHFSIGKCPLALTRVLGWAG